MSGDLGQRSPAIMRRTIRRHGAGHRPGACGAVGRALAPTVLAAVLLAGCRAGRIWNEYRAEPVEHSHIQQVAAEVVYPDAVVHELPAGAQQPITIKCEPPADDEYWNLTLQEAIEIAMLNSTVLRDLGATVLQTPANVRTVHGPALQATDPRFGVEAALSAFDAQFSTSTFFEKNDRAINNRFFGGGTRILEQDLHIYESQITKRAATGSEFSLRNHTEYDSNNAPGNLFGSAWTTWMDAEVRQPLLQGAGVDFNRIAGPATLPGVFNGVVIAQVNADVSALDFDLAMRDFVSNVESAYWELYYAYRDLDAKIAARDATLETWQIIKALGPKSGGEADKEARAREQYFRFEEEVQNALTGRMIEPTQTGSGSTGGTFRANGGVHLAERRLRLLMGVPIADGRIIRPADEPVMAEVVFDWAAISAEALSRRCELHRQRWEVRRRELELQASCNFLKPRLDAVGRYRWRGFGKDYLDPDGGRLGEFDNAWGNLTDGDFQEWQVGLEFTVPIGQRRAYSALRNAELALARERAILHEQERQIIFDLSNAYADAQRAYAVAKTNYNRRKAAREQLELVREALRRFQATPDQVLDAQRRLADAESRYFQSLVEYTLALKNVHLEKGSLMDYNGVLVAGGGATTPVPDASQNIHSWQGMRRLNPRESPELPGSAPALPPVPTEAAPPPEPDALSSPQTEGRPIEGSEAAAPAN